MPIQRDDADERIARLEKMMEEARAKPAGRGAFSAAKGVRESVQAKARITRPVAKSPARKNKSRP